MGKFCAIRAQFFAFWCSGVYFGEDFRSEVVDFRREISKMKKNLCRWLSYHSFRNRWTFFLTKISIVEWEKRSTIVTSETQFYWCGMWILHFLGVSGTTSSSKIKNENRMWVAIIVFVICLITKFQTHSSHGFCKKWSTLVTPCDNFLSK